MSVRKIDSYFGPQTSSTNEEELQKKQKLQIQWRKLLIWCNHGMCKVI